MNYKNTLALVTALMTCVCASAVYAPASEAGIADVIKVYAAEAEDGLSAASLCEKFEKNFLVGTVLDSSDINEDAEFFKRHFNSITPYTDLMPQRIISQEASQKNGDNVNTQIVFDEDTKKLLKFCEENDIAVRGSAFVCAQTPGWLFKENFSDKGDYVTSEIMNKRLESMIKNTFAAIKEQYPKLRVYAYDVCSEIFESDTGELKSEKANTLSQNWFDIYGSDEFAVNAFKYARKYAPADCKLYISDYNEFVPAKTEGVYNLAVKLSKEKTIDGIGMSAAVSENYPDMTVFETALNKFLSTGLEVQFTELTVSAEEKSEQAGIYSDIFALAVKNSDRISAVTLYKARDNKIGHVTGNCLFSSDCRPTPSYYAVMDVSTAADSEETDSEPEVSVMPGDVDGNNVVSSADIVKLVRALIGKAELTSAQKANADMNGDGMISVLDLIRLKNIFV